MEKNNLVINLGKRILSEANDLKRTSEALAIDISMDKEFVQKVIDGQCELIDSYKVIERMGEVYSIDISDLYLIDDDCDKAIKIMRACDSKKSSRVFKRKDKDHNRTKYYEYRDTAMSNLSPYKPEWIKQLRIVNNDDPQNPDVVYNNGHFMHQTTFFIGPVNFYWEINGKKFCREMSTGDSNYITPYWPHSFTSRDRNNEAFILAITFGGKVRYAQKEFYALGENSKNFVFDYRNHNRAICQLIKQHMMDENMTFNNLDLLAKQNSLNTNLEDKILNDKKLSNEELKFIAFALNIELHDLSMPKYKAEDEVVISNIKKQKQFYYPNDNNKLYEITNLARTTKMPQLKSFNFNVIAKSANCNLISSLHSYIYNYGNSDVEFLWEYEGNMHKEILSKDDSLYIQPFIKHGFSCINSNGLLYVVRVPGSINLSTQRELSYMANIDRVFSENVSWFS